MDKYINILIACDKNYAPFYGVMLNSLFRHNPQSRFDIYLLTDDSFGSNIRHQYEVLVASHNSRLTIRMVDKNDLASCPLNINHHVNLAGYYHFLMPKLLPPSVDKIIYMDGDMIVRGDIRPIWDIDMDGYAMSAPLDGNTFEQSQYARLGMKRRSGYVNNGFALFNLKYWREHNISDKMFSYVNEHYNALTLMDQDVENAVLEDVIKPMPIKYNFQILMFMDYFWRNFTPEFKEEVLASASSPIIVHYTGSIKPWNFKYFGWPYLHMWEEEASYTPWKHTRTRKPITKYIKYLIKRLIHSRRLYASRNAYFIKEAYELA